jgi:hypothetical protein
MKVKVSEASGNVLDWMVAKAMQCGPEKDLSAFGTVFCGWWRLTLGGEYERMPSYSTNWSQGGPIIEREIVERGLLMSSRLKRCEAVYPDKPEWAAYYGPTPLIAAMRCLVASKLGDTVEVPEELLV